MLHRYFPKQTKWFAEGLAQYLETYQWIDAETLRLGDPNLDAYRAYRAIRSLSVMDMLAWKSMDQRELQIAGLYGLSWAFIHYARNLETKTFGRFLASTAELGADAAFELHFGGRYEALDKAIFTYMKQGQYQQIVVKVPLTEPAAVAIEPASADEVERRLTVLEGATREK